MKRLFVTATNTDVGKTYATLQLIDALSDRGIRVGVCKPIETGVNAIPLDATALLDRVQRCNDAFASLTPQDITAFTFSLPAAPYCADSDHTIQLSKIQEKIDELSSKCDFLIIEGAGGLMVPITSNYYMIDLANALEAMT
ncbi:MAG TPA: dethiobiotin synthase, partial [Campylobacterales bacterium]|nr:dethiobiotin synthase [Campylobacterales bacterium]